MAGGDGNGEAERVLLLADSVEVVESSGGLVVEVVEEVDQGVTVVSCAPSSLAGMASPTPLLVHGVGIGKSVVSGLSAGDSS